MSRILATVALTAGALFATAGVAAAAEQPAAQQQHAVHQQPTIRATEPGLLGGVLRNLLGNGGVVDDVL